MLKLPVMFLTLCMLSFVSLASSDRAYLRAATVNDLAKIKVLMHDVWFDTYTKFYSVETVERVTFELQTIEYLSDQLCNPNITYLLAVSETNRE